MSDTLTRINQSVSALEAFPLENDHCPSQASSDAIGYSGCLDVGFKVCHFNQFTTPTAQHTIMSMLCLQQIEKQFVLFIDSSKLMSICKIHSKKKHFYVAFFFFFCFAPVCNVDKTGYLFDYLHTAFF